MSIRVQPASPDASGAGQSQAGIVGAVSRSTTSHGRPARGRLGIARTRSPVGRSGPASHAQARAAGVRNPAAAHASVLQPGLHDRRHAGPDRHEEGSAAAGTATARVQRDRQPARLAHQRAAGATGQAAGARGGQTRSRAGETGRGVAAGDGGSRRRVRGRGGAVAPGVFRTQRPAGGAMDPGGSHRATTAGDVDGRTVRSVTGDPMGRGGTRGRR